jgi:hypothetical protein
MFHLEVDAMGALESEARMASDDRPRPRPHPAIHTSAKAPTVDHFTFTARAI